MKRLLEKLHAALWQSGPRQFTVKQQQRQRLTTLLTLAPLVFFLCANPITSQWLNNSADTLRTPWQNSIATIQGGYVTASKAPCDTPPHTVLLGRYEVHGTAYEREFALRSTHRVRYSEEIREMLETGKFPIAFDPADPQRAFAPAAPVGAAWFTMLSVLIAPLLCVGLCFAAACDYLHIRRNAHSAAPECDAGGTGD